MSVRALSAPMLLALVGLSMGCGGSGGARVGAPTPVATPEQPQRVVLRDGDTEGPIGELPPALPGARIETATPGYLPRIALFQKQDVYLWPQSETYVTNTVYTNSTDKVVRPMMRWSGAGVITVSTAELDPDIAAEIEAGAAEASRVTGLTIAPGPNGQITVVIEPGNATFAVPNAPLAFTEWTVTQDRTITKVRLVFPDKANLVGSRKAGRANTFLHEMGHAVGIQGHSLDVGDIMSVDRFRSSGQQYGPAESLALKMMYRYRRNGNRVPDIDAGIGIAAAAAETLIVVD